MGIILHLDSILFPLRMGFKDYNVQRSYWVTPTANYSFTNQTANNTSLTTDYSCISPVILGWISKTIINIVYIILIKNKRLVCLKKKKVLHKCIRPMFQRVSTLSHEKTILWCANFVWICMMWIEWKQLKT